MKLQVNGRYMVLCPDISAWDLRDMENPKAQVVVVNGYPLKQDRILQEGDEIHFIEKGILPKAEEQEALMMARHSPGVHGRLKKATVAIAGLGGLGSHVAVALSRMGVGKLILIDYDVVDPSNLNRQNYAPSHIGMKKTKALTEQISNFAPFVKIISYDVCLEKSNIKKYMEEADIGVEAFDNPENKAMLMETWQKIWPQKPLVMASGLAGWGSANEIQTRKSLGKTYIVGDGYAEAKLGWGLMASRVMVAAGHQAQAVLRLILEKAPEGHI